LKYLISRSHALAWECSRDAPRLAPQRGAKAFPRGAWERENRNKTKIPDYLYAFTMPSLQALFYWGYIKQIV